VADIPLWQRYIERREFCVSRVIPECGEAAGHPIQVMGRSRDPCSVLRQRLLSLAQ
jgi:hypothetical protein